MKFTWFHLMPWPHMPEDFRQKHRSVWVDLPSGMYEPELGHIAYHQYLDQLEYAEKVGFDGIGVNEHHANAYGLMPSPNIMAATLTRRTSRSALVVLGNSIALYNPPLRVAEEFAMLDVLSGGRLIANGVSLATESRLIELFQKHGGDLVRLDVSRMAVAQLYVIDALRSRNSTPSRRKIAPSRVFASGAPPAVVMRGPSIRALALGVGASMAEVKLALRQQFAKVFGYETEKQACLMS